MLIFILKALTAVLISYLSGCVNYAIFITRLVTGKDIRTMGNLNPGTSNVMRHVGKVWAFLVALLHALKSMIPIIIFHLIWFREYSNQNFAVLYIIGIAAVIGHCKPVFYKFKGGGGVGPMQGVSLFFVPVEYLASMLIGGIIVQVVFRKAKYKFSQWTPVMFITMTPFMSLATSIWLDIPLFAHISIGGHLPAVVAGTFVLSLMILGINMRFMKQRKAELDTIKKDEEWDGDIAPR
ncbi:MAG: glycerol-3-phosphate acyltransferase [Spirochaetales bacterium]|nr:glycerol-3-phosphate acyltransferase [Spirochaetales bacterium]